MVDALEAERASKGEATRRGSADFVCDAPPEPAQPKSHKIVTDEPAP